MESCPEQRIIKLPAASQHRVSQLARGSDGPETQRPNPARERLLITDGATLSRCLLLRIMVWHQDGDMLRRDRLHYDHNAK
jgi:hypothetical protein